MESMVEAIPDVLITLLFFILVRSWAHESVWKMIDPVPCQVVLATEATFCVLVSISFMTGIVAPKAIHGFCCDNLTCGGEFVECDAEGIPCY
jgi:hypothetical protein